MYYYTPTINAYLQGFTAFESKEKTAGFEETHVVSDSPLEINWDNATEMQLEAKQSLEERMAKKCIQSHIIT